MRNREKSSKPSPEPPHPPPTQAPRSPVAAAQAASGLIAVPLIHRNHRRRGSRRCYRNGASRIRPHRGIPDPPQPPPTRAPRSPVAAAQAASGLTAVPLIHRTHRRRGSRRCYRNGASRIRLHRGAPDPPQPPPAQAASGRIASGPETTPNPVTMAGSTGCRPASITRANLQALPALICIESCKLACHDHLVRLFISGNQ